MGGGSWSFDAFQNLSSSRVSKSADDIFVNNKTNKISSDMSPRGIKFREARDSDAHPESLAIMFNLDVTGSMGKIPEIIARQKLGTLMDTLIKHGVNDAAVLFNAIGDHHSDLFPLQIGQFESGTAELDKWLTSVNIEGNGGGQEKESYLLAWYLAARHTSIDCFEKRGQKGFLFTVGDESVWDNVDIKDIRSSELRDFLKESEITSFKATDVLAEAQRMYHVFHIHINHTSYNETQLINNWKQLLGERLIVLDNYEDIAEVVASTVAMIRGVELADITKNFNSSTAATVSKALATLDTSIVKTQTGVIKF